MALIEYVEPVSVGQALVGLGMLILFCTFAYIFYRIYIKFAQYLDILLNREMKYEVMEETYLDGLAAKKGIDLNEELIKRKVIREIKNKTFRKRLEDQVFEQMFGKEEKKKK